MKQAGPTSENTNMPDSPVTALDALDADELLMLGLRANAVGGGDSLGFFKLAVAHDPAHAKAHWALASEYASLRMPERAREHFARAVELDPAQPVARFQYGLLCLTQGDVTCTIERATPETMVRRAAPHNGRGRYAVL
jgi:tetratricopeptide (TPR) repeat protein